MKILILGVFRGKYTSNFKMPERNDSPGTRIPKKAGTLIPAF